MKKHEPRENIKKLMKPEGWDAEPRHSRSGSAFFLFIDYNPDYVVAHILNPCEHSVIESDIL